MQIKHEFFVINGIVTLGEIVFGRNAVVPVYVHIFSVFTSCYGVKYQNRKEFSILPVFKVWSVILKKNCI